VFGFDGGGDAHTFKGEMVKPLLDAAAHFKPLWQKPTVDMPAIPVAERERA
jgi:hypothetical protein